MVATRARPGSRLPNTCLPWPQRFDLCDDYSGCGEGRVQGMPARPKVDHELTLGEDTCNFSPEYRSRPHQSVRRHKMSSDTHSRCYTISGGSGNSGISRVTCLGQSKPGRPPWEQLPSLPICKIFVEARNEPCLVVHTSGTTASPKPVVFTHDFVASFIQFSQLVPPPGFEVQVALCQSNRFFVALPFFHVRLHALKTPQQPCDNAYQYLANCWH